jgi:hypothetical protein
MDSVPSAFSDSLGPAVLVKFYLLQLIRELGRSTRCAPEIMVRGSAWAPMGPVACQVGFSHRENVPAQRIAAQKPATRTGTTH